MRNIILLIITLSFLSIDSVWAKDNEHVAFLKQLAKELNHTTTANIPSELNLSKVEYSYKKKCFTISMYIEFDNDTKKEIEAKYPSSLHTELFRVLAGQLINTALGDNLAQMTALEMDENNTGFLEHLVMSESELSVVLKMPYLNVEKNQVLSLEQLNNIYHSDKDVLKLKFVFNVTNKFLPLKLSPSLTAEKCDIDKDCKFSTHITIDDFSNTDDRISAIRFALKILSTKNSSTELLVKKGKDAFVVFTEKRTQKTFIDTIPSSLIKDIVNYPDTLNHETLSMLSTSIGGRSLFPRETAYGRDVEVIGMFYNLKNKTSNYIFSCRPTKKGKNIFSMQKRLSKYPQLFCFSTNNSLLRNTLIGDSSSYTFYMLSDNRDIIDSLRINLDNKQFARLSKLKETQRDSLTLQIAFISNQVFSYADTMYIQGNNIVWEETRSEYPIFVKRADAKKLFKNEMIKELDGNSFHSAIKPFHKNLVFRIRKPKGTRNDYVDILIKYDELFKDNVIDNRFLKVNEKVIDEIPPQEVKVFDVVDQMPTFDTYTYDVIIRDPSNPEKYVTETITESGDKALMAYLNSNVHYPIIAEENGIQGRVVTTFVIERDGSITDVKVIKSVDPSLDKEAVRVVSSMPKWVPGKQDGEPVRVKFTLPVTFRLQ